MPGPSLTNNFIGSFNFLVKVEGFSTELNGFTACSGIKSVTEVYPFKHGMDTHMRQAAGRTLYEPVSLERVYSGLDEFAQWRDKVESGNIERRNVIIEYHTANKTVVSRFMLINAFPSRWETPDLNALGSDTAIERIELTFERVVREFSGAHLGQKWWKDAVAGKAPSFPDWVKSPGAKTIAGKTPPQPDWVRNPGAQTIAGKSPPRPDWVKNPGSQTIAGKSPPRPDWVLNPGTSAVNRASPPSPAWVKQGGTGGTSKKGPPMPDWVKNPGTSEVPRRSLEYPDWVLKK